MMFMKGYTLQGFAKRVYHLHVRYPGDWDELYFRDYLKRHREAAEEYGKLKIGLQKKYEHDRDAYTRAKTDFVRECTKKGPEGVRRYLSAGRGKVKKFFKKALAFF